MENIFEFVANIVEAVLTVELFVRYFGLKNKKLAVMKILLMVTIYTAVITMSNMFAYFSVHEEYIVDTMILVLAVVFLKGRMLEKILLIFMNSIILSTTGILLTGVFGNFILYDANGYPEFGVLRVYLQRLSI